MWTEARSKRDEDRCEARGEEWGGGGEGRVLAWHENYLRRSGRGQMNSFRTQFVVNGLARDKCLLPLSSVVNAHRGVIKLEPPE